MSGKINTALIGAYFIGDIATLIYLVFFDGAKYNWWNWLITVPIDFALSTIWPIYWLILRPFFGA